MQNPRVTVFRQRALHVAVDSGVKMHATQAHKIVIALDAPLHVEHAGRTFETRACWVGPHATQAMGARGRVVALFVEPGAFGTAHRLGVPEIRELSARELDAATAVASRIAEHDGSADAAAVDELLGVLVRDRSPSLDTRVHRALELVARDAGIDACAVARDVGLSQERLRHVVAESTGLSLRAHRLWHRTLDAVERLAAGQPLARVAADAGFADHAHLTRSFARFFGRAPSSLDEPIRVVAPYVERFG